jgi:hypothetical protein
MGLLASIPLVASQFVSGWEQDFLLNLGFLALGVLLTVIYVDWALERHEHRRWAMPRAIAAIRIRRAATSFIYSTTLALGFDALDPRLFIAGWHQRIDPLDANRQLHTNPKWIQLVREDVIPVSRKTNNALDPDDVRQIVTALDLYEKRIRELLALLQGYLSPSQVEHLSSILDRIPVERHRANVLEYGNENYPGPELANLIERSLALIEESNRNDDAFLATVE